VGSESRRKALNSVTSQLPERLAAGSNGVLPVSEAQWRRSLDDATLTLLFTEYGSRRRAVLDVAEATDAAIGRKLRPAVLRFVETARQLAETLSLLAVLRPDMVVSDLAAGTHDQLAVDADAVITAVIDGRVAPSEPAWPDLAAMTTSGNDPVLALFDSEAEDLADEQGRFSDARLLARYRLRLPELEARCDPVLKLIARRPISVFAGATAVRDLATSASPFLTLRTAKAVKSQLIEAVARDPDRTLAVIAEAAQGTERDWFNFARLTNALVHANDATTERDRATSYLQAYKHMAEGIVRHWVWTLLRLSGLDGEAPPVGVLGEPAIARLGELGKHVASALEPAMRNAEAHDDFVFDDDDGMLVTGEQRFSEADIQARLTELDILQRGFIVGRLAAFADEPRLDGDVPKDERLNSPSRDLVDARQRFGHAGQRVRSFVRDRDVITVVIDDLRPEACNPCLLALTQVAQIQSLRRVSRLVVRVADREDPVVDLPAPVVAANYPVLMLTLQFFPDTLPQVTFLPCLTWARLACETEEQALRAAAWFALNDAQHAIRDLEESARLAMRFSERLLVVNAAASATLSLFADSEHLKPLKRSHRMVRGLRNAWRDGYTASTGTQLAGIARAMDQLGDPPAILPTLDKRSITEALDRHATS
jgi:hypothetical protein